MSNIVKRGNNSYRLVVELGYDGKGKRIRRTRTIKVQDAALLKSKKKLNSYLEQELLKFKIEIEAGEYISPEKMRFGPFVEEWKQKYGKKHLSANTMETYEYLLNAHIINTFKEKRLEDIKPLHVVNYLDGLEELSLSSATIRFHYRILNDLFKRAVEWKLIKENPVKNISKPKVVNKDGDVYTEQEVIELFNLLEKEMIHWKIMIKIAITAGLRRGELLGLQWDDIDFERNTITINHSLTHTKTGGYSLKTPKTKFSKRTVSVPSSIMDELKVYKVSKMKERMQTAELWEGGEHFFVFSTWNGKPYYPAAATRWWKRFIDRTGFRFIRFHDLRHTSATLLINRGVHAKIISSRLGHADIRTTMNIYGHALRDADQGAADKFDDILNSKKA